jgi:hypothetical protein
MGLIPEEPRMISFVFKRCFLGFLLSPFTRATSSSVANLPISRRGCMTVVSQSHATPFSSRSNSTTGTLRSRTFCKARHSLLDATKLPCEHGLSRIQQTVPENDHVYVRIADYQNVPLERRTRSTKRCYQSSFCEASSSLCAK